MSCTAFQTLFWLCFVPGSAPITFSFASFAGMGAAYGTAKAGVGIASMGVMRPELVMKSIVPVVMAGVLGIYGLIIAVIISTGGMLLAEVLRIACLQRLMSAACVVKQKPVAILSYNVPSFRAFARCVLSIAIF